MGTSETSQFVRLRVDLVIGIEDSVALTGAALQRIEDDAAQVRADRAGDPEGADAPGGMGELVDVHHMSDDERLQAISAVQQDEAEALAYLIDPFDLVGDVPGVELAQASWSSEDIDYDPDSPDWHLDEHDDDEDDEDDGSEADRI
jgi:hypothetical protein